MKYLGRRKPYTVIGIRRCWCARCGKRRGYATWTICANGNRHVVMCKRCDVALNAMVLRWMRIPGGLGAALMIAYRTKVAAAP